MSFINIILDFSSNQYSDIELTGRSDTIDVKMTDNPDYPDPKPTLVQLRTDTENLKGAIINAQDGGKKETVLKNEFRATLEITLKTLALYVFQASGGNEAKILGAGFFVRKKNEPVGVLDIPTHVTVKPGIAKGSLEVACEVVKHADYYELEYAEAPITASSVIIHKTARKRKFLIEGLTSGKQVGFRMAAAGTNPARNWSDFVYSYVL